METRPSAHPELGPARTIGAASALVAWGSAYTLYALLYASAVRLTLDLGVATSLLAGLAHTLPEALATPLVLRYAVSEKPSAGRSATGLAPPGRLLLLAAAFVSWSVVGSAFGFAVVRACEPAPWSLPLRYGNLVWKATTSLLVFLVLAAFAAARLHARRAREASENALRAGALRAEARLAVLRAQLNPHFILNVLHSLMGLAERDPRATSRSLESLGGTLQYALRVQSHGIDSVMLRDELAFTREYLELERMRLGERLETRFFVDGAPLHRLVPPFVLQPLVENAVLHGIAPRARGGVVSIRIEEDSGALVLAVEDDGAPVSAAAPDLHCGNGLGLRLLRERLEALYGDNATVRVDQSLLGGLRATVRLVGEPAGPLEEED